MKLINLVAGVVATLFVMVALMKDDGSLAIRIVNAILVAVAVLIVVAAAADGAWK